MHTKKERGNWFNFVVFEECYNQQVCFYSQVNLFAVLAVNVYAYNNIWDLLSAGNAISVVRDRSNVMQSEGMSNLSLSLAALLLLSSSVSPSPGLLSVKV